MSTAGYDKDFVYYDYVKINENLKKVEEMHKKIWISSSFFCAFALKYIVSPAIFQKQG